MFLKWSKLRPPSRFSNRIYRKSLGIGLGVLLMAVFSVAPADVRLVNISTRAPIQGGAGDIIAGFIIEGTGTQRVVIRGWDLEPGVDAKLTLRKFPSSELVASNDNWQDDPRSAEIPSHMISHYDKFDAALLLDLAAGAYTVTLSSMGEKGLGLVGIDAIDGTAIKLINISTRAPIQGGAGDVIAGFIIEGTETQRVVIRGWDLEPEVDAKLTIRKFPSSEFVASNDNWQDDSRYAEIPNHMISHYDKFDAALLLDLAAGAYTVTLSSVGGKGIGLVGVDAIKTGPIYSSTPASGNTLDFGSIDVGKSITKNITITNIGGAGSNLNIDIGSVSSTFSINPSQSFTVSSGSSKTVTVQCNPTTAGSYSSTLRINSNDNNNSQNYYYLQCEGKKNPLPTPCVEFSPKSSLDFGKVKTDTTVTKEIAIMENCGAALKVDYLNITGTGSHVSNFKVTSPHSVNVDSNSIERMSVTFACKSSDKGLREAKLELRTNDPKNKLPTFVLKGECETDCPTVDFDPQGRSDFIPSLGFGYDKQRDLHKPQSCLNGNSAQVGSGEAKLDFTLVSSYEQLKKELGITVDLNIGAKIFKLNSHSEFAIKHQETKLSKSMVLKSEILSHQQFNQQGLNAFGQGKLDDGTQCFISACGDNFIYQADVGGKLFVAMKFDFTSEEHKKTFFSSLGVSYDMVDVKATVNKLNQSTIKGGSLTLSAHQIGGDTTKLGNVFGNSSNFINCSFMDNLTSCETAMKNAIDYARNGFANSVNTHTQVLNFKSMSYSNMGISLSPIDVPMDIIRARTNLAGLYQQQYGDWALAESWLNNKSFANDFTFVEKSHLQQLQNTIRGNLDMIRNAGLWCFSDLSRCLDKKQAALSSLEEYDKTWLYGIKVIQVGGTEEYSYEDSVTLGYFKVNSGCTPWKSARKCSSDTGEICLPSNCVVDMSRSSYYSGENLEGNDAQPGIGINVTSINVHNKSYATNKIDELCLKSYVKMCSENKHCGGGSWYEGTHTIYGKCTREVQVPKLYVPDLP